VGERLAATRKGGNAGAALTSTKKGDNFPYPFKTSFPYPRKLGAAGDREKRDRVTALVFSIVPLLTGPHMRPPVSSLSSFFELRSMTRSNREDWKGKEFGTSPIKERSEYRGAGAGQTDKWRGGVTM